MGVGKGAIREFGSLERRAPRTSFDDATNSWKNCLPRQHDLKPYCPAIQILAAMLIGPPGGFPKAAMGGTDAGSLIKVQVAGTIPPAGKHQACQIVKCFARCVLAHPSLAHGLFTRSA